MGLLASSSDIRWNVAKVQIWVAIVRRACRLRKPPNKSIDCGEPVASTPLELHRWREPEKWKSPHILRLHPYPADCCGNDELSFYEERARRADEHLSSRRQLRSAALAKWSLQQVGDSR